jgi:phosphoglycerol transferase MdoB-like AlkP superfamily enzyme
MDETPGAPAPVPARTFLATLRGRVGAAIAPYRLPIVIVGLHLILFLLARLAILILYWPEFAPLSAGTIAWGFVRGVRFDAAILVVVAGIPLWLLTLPFGWARGRVWRGIWGWACFATLVLFLLVLAVDVFYFEYVHRHIGPELTFLRESFEAVALSAMRQYIVPVVLFLAVVGGLFWLWRRVMRIAPVAVRPGLVRLVATAALAVVLFYVARGSVTGKRLKVIAAFTDAPPAAAYLALNGAFTALHSVDDTRSLKADFYPWPEALETVKADLFAPGETPVSPEDYPLFRRRPAKGGAKPNIVLMMMESWDAFYTDVYRRELGQPPLGLTPCFDALSRDGVRFSRFYACGQKSMDGMCALICGFPTLPRMPYLGRGMEQNGLTYLGHLAQREGYSTYFLQSSKRASFRNDAVAAIAGFTTYLGGEDLSPAASTGDRSMLGGASWDHETFTEASRRFAAAPKPFLGYLYSSSTHPPFAWPEKRWERYPPDSYEHRYMNSLGYMDSVFGQLIADAKAAGYYDTTVFILTADHVGCSKSGGLADPPSMHHIPCLILGPGIRPGVVTRIGGQLDVIPTIVDLAGWGEPQAALGRSLFDETAPDRGAFLYEADLVLRVEEDGYVAHNLQRRIVAKGPRPDAIERRLLSYLQVAGTLLRRNRVAPSR